MKLRTRLIVVFLLLSVAPLGAITFYSYTSNVRALQEAAAHEADLLAAELGERMQLVTAKLSERVVHLLDLPAPPDTAVESGVLNDQIADALGEAALLLNNVEMPTAALAVGEAGHRQTARANRLRAGASIAARGPFRGRRCRRLRHRPQAIASSSTWDRFAAISTGRSCRWDGQKT